MKVTLGLPAVLALVLGVLPGDLPAQLNENCTVSILNRTTRVRADGSWRIENVPATFGGVRARATCVENAITASGSTSVVNVLGVSGVLGSACLDPSYGTFYTSRADFETKAVDGFAQLLIFDPVGLGGGLFQVRKPDLSTAGDDIRFNEGTANLCE